ncbi:structure-specific endonuclease subunit SLX4 [Anopheles nili]|uniref:structure-specific endonuclease subunit SLX4 n=1 Tax=Anopheles nili TaxID=185578 RepID=UPI00237AF958|nr:structure-specific endonuclease subunit SLX4 [Anopheles nili]
MSKRLKYAKLRLAKPAADNPPSHGAGVEEVKTTGLLDVGACSRLIGKPSKYFSNDLEEPTASQQTFIEYASEPLMDNNGESSEPNTRRRTQEVPECNPLDGPKLPKLRKKALGDDDFEEAKSSTSSQTKPTKVQRAAKKLKAPKRPKNQGDIRKVFRKYKNDHEVLHKLLKEHSVSEQIDPEQLQMALAMSRSLVDYECGLNPVAGEEMQEQQLASSSSSIQERRIVEKISAPSQVTTESTSLNDNGSVHQVPIDLVLSEGLCNKAVQNEQCMSVAEQGDASATAKNSNCHIATVPSKDLSFNRIAIKARLTEALRGDSNMVETVSLVGDTESVKELDTSASNSNEVISSSPSKVNCTQPSDTQDDVLVISDDEINYSIRDVLPRDAPRDIACAKNGTENSLNNDLNITVPYYDGHTTSQNESVVTNSTSSGSQAVMQSDCEVVTICSSESDMVSAVVEGADSTFAYLDNLVKQFNLPPLRAQLSASKCHSPPKQLEAVLNLSSQTRTIQYATDAENVLTDEQQSPDSTSKAHAKNTKQGNVISENLDNYLNYYEEPNFEEHEIEAESQACERPEKDSCLTSILASSAKPFSRAKSSTQLDSPTNCVTLKRIASESSIGCSSTPQDKELASDKRQKGDEFVDKFNDLKAAVPVIAPPEYVINTSIVKTDAPAYTAMSASEIDRELYKFGLKALTRSKAIRVLNYLFEQMHPYVDVLEDTAEDPKLSVDSQKASAKGHKHISSVSTNIGHEKPAKCAFKLNVNEAEYFLPSKPRKKIHWCAVPLHISFFNLASESENLQRQILRYEPVNLDDIYKNLKNAGLRYETNDLIAFLDKHCITFRTVSGSGDRVAKTASKNGSK